MKKVKIGNKYFNADNIAYLEYVTNPDKSKHWVKVALTSKSVNEKGYLQNDSILIEFQNEGLCNLAIENA